MIAIAVGLVSHSYALTSLFPYVGYMVQSLGITDDKDEAGQSVLQTARSTSSFRFRLEMQGNRERGEDGDQLGSVSFWARASPTTTGRVHHAVSLRPTH